MFAAILVIPQLCIWTVEIMHLLQTQMKIALNYGGENSPVPNNIFQSCCTQLCGNSFGGRLCGKIVHVDVF